MYQKLEVKARVDPEIWEKLHQYRISRIRELGKKISISQALEELLRKALP